MHTSYVLELICWK